MYSEGTAFLDRAGRVVAADEGFRASLGLPDGDATAALRLRAGTDASLRALLAGEGPDLARVEAAAGDGPVDLVRTACPEGTFLRARPAAGLAAPALEYAMHALVVARLAGGVAHEVKNPLNAMALQIALLGDKVGSAGEPVASACANNLSRLKDQIGRVDDVVRRFADVTDPPSGPSFDAGALAADVASLFTHEARRRRVALSCEASAGTVQAIGDGARAARVLLGLAWRGLSRPSEEARLLVRAAHEGGDAVLSVEHAPEADPALEWVVEVARAAAGEMGGRLERARAGGGERLELRLRREIPA